MNNNFNGNNLPQTTNGNNPFEIFDYLDKGGVRMVRDNYGNPWFCLNDICLILEIKEPHRVSARIPDPYRTFMTVWVQTGIKADGSPATRNTNMIFVNEVGLYFAIGKSTKPEAEKFRLWLYSEVIPSIRQNGYYALPQMTEMEMINKISAEMINLQGTVNNLVNTQTDVVNRLTRVEQIQQEQLEMNALTVRRYAEIMCVVIDNVTAQYIGKLATQISKATGLPYTEDPQGNLYTALALSVAFQKANIQMNLN